MGIYMGIMHIVYIGSKKKAVKYLGKLYSDLHDAQIRDIAIGDDMEITYIHLLFLGSSSDFSAAIRL